MPKSSSKLRNLIASLKAFITTIDSVSIIDRAMIDYKVNLQLTGPLARMNKFSVGGCLSKSHVSQNPHIPPTNKHPYLRHTLNQYYDTRI